MILSSAAERTGQIYQMNKLKYAIEGILFAAGESVKASMLAVALDKDIAEVEAAVEELKDEYNNDHRGFTIIDIDEGYQICSRPEYYTYIQEILGEQRRQALSNAAMETLAIIAYKQPVTRSGIEYVRGVNSDGSVNRLVERGLVEEVGRMDAPGRPILYGTTKNFLRCFGLAGLSELPEVNLEKLTSGMPDENVKIIEESLPNNEPAGKENGQVSENAVSPENKTEDME